MPESCTYVTPWRGECSDDLAPSSDTVCEEHAEKTCWCGEQAVTECDATEGLMCGQPLCEDHGCIQKYHDGRPHDEEGRHQWAEFGGVEE